MQGRSVSGQFRSVSQRVLTRIRGPVFRRVIPLFLAVTVAAAPAVLATPAQGAAGANLYIVQGLPGRTLDISVDGHSVATGVQAAQIVGPFGGCCGQADDHCQAGREGGHPASGDGWIRGQHGRRDPSAGLADGGAGDHLVREQAGLGPEGQGSAPGGAHRGGRPGRHPGERQSAVLQCRERGIPRRSRSGGHVQGRDRAHRRDVTCCSRSVGFAGEGWLSDPGIRGRRTESEDDDGRGRHDQTPGLGVGHAEPGEHRDRRTGGRG